jgi:hypothetical protein
MFEEKRGGKGPTLPDMQAMGTDMWGVIMLPRRFGI